MGGFIIKENSNLQGFYPGPDYIDYSGNGNDGTITGTDEIANPTGTRIRNYDGTSSDLTDLEFTISPQSSITFMAWIKHDGKTSEYNAIIANQNSAGSNGYSMQKNASNIIEFYIGGFSPSTVAGTTTLTTDVWYHAVLTYDGTTAKIYINGEEENSATGTPTVNAGGNTHVSRAGDYAGRYFDGDIADVAVWTRALSPEEIKHIYKKTYRS